MAKMENSDRNPASTIENSVNELNQLTEQDELSDQQLDWVSGGGSTTVVTKYRLNGNIKSQTTTTVD